MANRTYTRAQRRTIDTYNGAIRQAVGLQRILETAREVGNESYIERLEEEIAELETWGEQLIEQAIELGLDPEDLA